MGSNQQITEKALIDEVQAGEPEKLHRMLTKADAKVIGRANLVHVAVTAGRPDMIAPLAAHGASLEVLDSHGHTPLLAAVIAGRTDMIAPLAAHGASLEVLDGIGRTPLWVAMESENPGLVRELGKRGANTEALNPQYEQASPLLVAAFRGDTAMLEALLDADADVNYRGRHGRTPLHWAMLREGLTGDRAPAQLLISRGADRTAATEQGWLPEDWCRITGS